MSHIYLDYAAATAVDADVLAAMFPYFSESFYNPSALYEGARDAKHALEGARSRVAATIGCRPSEVLFVAGGTESTNLAIRGIAEQYPGSGVCISAVEHEAVRAPAARYDATVCPVDARGVVDTSTLKSAINDQTVLISVMYANNEVGTVQPIKEIVEIVDVIRKDRRKRGLKLPMYVHIDACQAPMYLDCNVARLGVDLMTLNGGKIHGPKQSGILYVKAGVILQPQIMGGGQEYGLRSGTEHVAGAVGFSVALEKAQQNHKSNASSARTLTGAFIHQLKGKYGAEIHGHSKKRLPNNVHATFPGHDNERILFSLDEQGVWAAAGSACSASNEEVSHVLSAMGVSEADARSSIRFTIGRDTTQQELDTVIICLEKALQA